ncbi:hypothetical protein AM202_02310 [Actinobacillus minor 202]|uniref:Uncharacterized protein n=1 Tax=Actinobacillus minor 202 TaxID=591023 RepID=A0ABM9YUS6_9PAST|nr:hypothetical protein AM202_02310 [Actinobacillus minor 202]
MSQFLRTLLIIIIAVVMNFYLTSLGIDIVYRFAIAIPTIYLVVWLLEKAIAYFTKSKKK